MTGNPTTPAAGRAAFASALAVSHETLARFDAYAALLARWQARINLVGPKTLPEVWTRHFLDSGQLAALLPDGARRLIDLGSGAGFPGLVLALLRPELEVRLIESDQRKAAFLREAARATGAANVVVLALRAEDYQGPKADVVTARALAPLSQLLTLAAPMLLHLGCCLFLKGEMWRKELTEARETWNMVAVSRPSMTGSAEAASGVALAITEIRHAARSD